MTWSVLIHISLPHVFLSIWLKLMIKLEFIVGQGKVYSPCYAMASRNPGFNSSASAYSRWSTRLGSPERAFDDECTSSGLIANTPPRGTRVSIFSCVLARPRILSSLKTPERCEPGMTRSGPFSLVEASREMRSARTRDSAQAGACA
jgi:hypothetical protein